MWRHSEKWAVGPIPEPRSPTQSTISESGDGRNRPGSPSQQLADSCLYLGLARAVLDLHIAHPCLFQRDALDPVPPLCCTTDVMPAATKAGSQACLGIILFCLGFPEQAMTQSNTAIAEAGRLVHPPALAQSLAFSSRLLSLVGENAALHARAGELIAVGTDQGFPVWRALGTIHRGWANVQNGNVTEGMSLIGNVSYKERFGGLLCHRSRAVDALSYCSPGQRM